MEPILKLSDEISGGDGDDDDEDDESLIPFVGTREELLNYDQILRGERNFISYQDYL